MKIVVFGDSILKGVITTPETTSLFDVTENNSLSLAQKELNFELDNRSIYGNIISKAQSKFNKWLEKDGTADICIIEFGDNDSDYDWTQIDQNPEGNFSKKTTEEDFVRILDEMVKACKARKIIPLLATAPALVPERWINTISKNLNKENILKFLNNDINQLLKNQEDYANLLLKYAKENDIICVDFRNQLLKETNYGDLICIDGIHPNEKGYKIMSKIWIEKLSELSKNF